jgi:head-tail adaptor
MDASLLAEARFDVLAELTATATVMRRGSGASDSAGGRTSAYASAGTYPCQVQTRTPSPREDPRAGAISAKSTHILVLPWNAVIRVSDRLTVGSSTFEVQDTNADMTDRFSLDVYCIRIS